MTITSAIVGAVTPSSARVISECDGQNVRLAVAEGDDFTTLPDLFGPYISSETGMINMEAEGLEPDTSYGYRIWDDSLGLQCTGVEGDYVSTPDAPAFDIAGDIEIRMDITADDWTPSVNQTVVSKWDFDGGETSYQVRVDSNGTIRMQWSDASGNQGESSTVAPSVINGGREVIIIRLDVDNGSGGYDVSYYTAENIDDAESQWTQLGSTVTGASTSNIQSSDAEVGVGARSADGGQPFAGEVHEVHIYDGIDPLTQTAVTVLRPYAAEEGTTSFTDDQGNVWDVQGNATIVGALTGKFNTFPPAGSDSSFSFIVSGDAGLTPDFPDTTGEALIEDRISNPPVCDTIRNHNPLFFMHLGDMHYYNPGGTQGSGNEVADYRRAWEDVLLQSRQHQLYREVPLVYVWDDHDYGANNSHGGNPGKFNAGQVYREKFPAYELPDPGGAVFHSFEVGRILFVMWDTRFYRDVWTNPDGPGHTMLGQDQKDWFNQVLTQSSAEFLFIASSVPWIGDVELEEVGPDSWGGYELERSELGDLIETLGWGEKVAFLSADAHTLAIDSGIHNFWPANAPAYLMASMDATPSGVTGPYDLGISNGRKQFGRVTVTDQGDTIAIRVDCIQDTEILFSHFFEVDADPLGPGGPGPVLPPVAGDGLSALIEGIVDPAVDWKSFDFVTGELIADLPEVSGSISRRIGAHTTSDLTIPMPIAGNLALGRIILQATTPGRAMLVCVVNNQPAWAGRVVARSGGSAGSLRVSASTIEGYFARRFVQDHSFINADEAAIMRSLMEDAGPRVIPGLGLTGGINLGFEAPNIGVAGEGQYLKQNRTSVYDALRERSAREDGLEWTIEVFWDNAAETRVRKVVRVGPRIGVESNNPVAVFEITARAVFESTGGNEATYELDEDYSSDRGATWVEVYSTGEGEDQPESDPQIATDLISRGWPIDEVNFRPDSEITDVAILNNHARAGLSLRQHGAQLWTIQARWNVTPKLNVEWRLGDDIAWNVIGHRHPEGVTGQGRCIGWDMDPEAGLVSPIMLDPISDEGVG